jgi:hypothetical protein
MEFAACIVPAAAVRKKPSHRVEMVNQLLFGETARIVKKKNKWLMVQGMHDNYEGWIRSNLMMQIEENPSNNLFVASDLMNTITINSVQMHIPAGASLPGIKEGKGQIGNLAYEFRGALFNRNEIKPDEEVVRRLTMQWLNAPYLWGGRTPMGVDCSGFVQVIFKMMGIDLLRDAKQQAGQGIKIKKLTRAVSGDLAFFRNKNGKITHVGILLSPSAIIHASGKVRIDVIDEKGITNTDTKRRTHSLAAIRRFW